jgi:hypothetical protein
MLTFPRRVFGVQGETRTHDVEWRFVGALQSPLCDPPVWWSREISKLRPIAYQAIALPLSYETLILATYFCGDGGKC